MKTSLNFKKQITKLVIPIFVLAIAFASHAREREPNDLKSFKVVVEKTDNGVKLTCKNGCAWKNLAFSLNDSQSQAINEYGMTDLDENLSNEDADMLFT